MKKPHMTIAEQSDILSASIPVADNLTGIAKIEASLIAQSFVKVDGYYSSEGDVPPIISVWRNFDVMAMITLTTDGELRVFTSRGMLNVG